MNILTVTLGLVVAAFGSAEDNLGDPTQVSYPCDLCVLFIAVAESFLI